MAITSIVKVGNATKLVGDDSSINYLLPNKRIRLDTDSGLIQWWDYKFSIDENLHYQKILYSDQTEVYGTSTPEEFVEYLIINNFFLPKSLEVSLQDQTTQAVISRFVNFTVATTITAEAAIGTKIVSVADATGMAVGQHFTIFNQAVGRWTLGEIVAINSLDITIDSPLDWTLPVGSDMSTGSYDLSVDGSVTPVEFALRGGTPAEDALAIEFDITRIVIQCKTSSAGALNFFGNIARLTNGLLFRRVDGSVQNIFNVKDNGGLANLSFDFSFYTASGHGTDGFVCRISFAGQDKMGVALRIGAGEDLQFIVQDDLTSLTSLYVVAEGHVVEP